MRTTTLIRYGFIFILVIVGFQLLKQIHPLTLLVVGGIIAYSKGWIS